MSESQLGTRLERSLSAIGGGAVGTVVMTVFLGFIAVETRSQLGFFDAISRFSGVPAQPVFGFGLFVLAGIVVWPLLFVAIESYLPGSNPHANGLIVAAILWIAFVNTGTQLSEPTALILYGGLTLLAFLIYGLTFGEIYSQLLRRRV